MDYKAVIVLLVTAVAGGVCLAQTEESADSGDWKPSSLNQPGQEYPQVNSEGRARFRIHAPQAQSVIVSLGRLALTKGEDGFWVGATPRAVR